jgi:hypothetical protein
VIHIWKAEYAEDDSLVDRHADVFATAHYSIVLNEQASPAALRGRSKSVRKIFSAYRNGAVLD